VHIGCWNNQRLNRLEVETNWWWKREILLLQNILSKYLIRQIKELVECLMKNALNRVEINGQNLIKPIFIQSYKSSKAWF
jgi:hypothetical protein